MIDIIYVLSTGAVVSEGISQQKEIELPWGQNSRSKNKEDERTKTERKHRERERERKRKSNLSFESKLH